MGGAGSEGSGCVTLNNQMFPPEVKQQAMVACGRRCCLCHKFCGVGMECHHIIPESKGGPDTLENCIPLCFDCHAEVGHYNSEHPKGTKFTLVELRSHRDNWYSKSAQGYISSPPSEHLAQDQSLFKTLYILLGGSEAMMHFHDHDYGGSYLVEYDKHIINFRRRRDLPETEFFSVAMEAAASDLTKAVMDYQKAGVNRIWWHHNGKGLAGVPSEWLDGKEPLQAERFWEAVKVMNAEAQKIWDAFSNFIKEGRRTLKIDPDESWLSDGHQENPIQNPAR